MNKKRNITIAVILIVAIVGFFAFRTFAKNTQDSVTADLQTEAAQRGSLEAYVGGTGSVRSNQNVTLSWQTNGTVGRVNVELGDDVQAGDVLAELSTSSLPQTLILARADLVAAQDALEDLYDSFGPLALALAQQQLADARDALEHAEDEWDGIHYKGDQDEIDDAREAYRDAEDALELAADYYSKTSVQYKRVYQAYASALAHYNYVSGNTVDEIKEAQYAAALEVANQQLVEAQAEYDRLLAGPTEDEIAAADARVFAAEAALQQAWIEAPFAGTVTLAQPLVGDQVGPGTTAFRVDDLSRLLVDVQISEVDINRVAVGQLALLRFDAILANEYTGEVIEVSPVGAVDQGLVNFKVTIALTDFDDQIKPGMTAAVNIRVEELEDVLLVPNRAVRAVEGQRVVYVLSDSGSIDMIEIELGATSDENSEVISGDLSVGDEVILNPPTSFFNMMNGGPFGGR
jgi:HlyD family secretion protein